MQPYSHHRVLTASADEHAREESVRMHQVVGGDRLDQIAAQVYGDPAYWRVIAMYNDLADPLRLTPGEVLRIPLRVLLEEES